MDDREYFRESRLRRNLSLHDISVSLSEEMGYRVTRASLANWELRRVEQPRLPIARAVQRQVANWRREDRASGSVVREVHSYEVDYTCECGAMVPGPMTGARHCLMCGAAFGEPCCLSCGVPLQAGYRFCPACGVSVTPATDGE